jgi:hypothetical protein
MYPLTIGLAIENRELWEQAQACLADLPFRVIVEHQDIGDVSNFLDRLERMRPDVVLMDISGWREPLEGLVSSIRGATGDPMIIALNTVGRSGRHSVVDAGGNQRVPVPAAAGPAAQGAREALGGTQPQRDWRSQRAARACLLFRQGRLRRHHSGLPRGRGTGPAEPESAFDGSGSGRRHGGLHHQDQVGVLDLDAVNNLHRLDIHYWKALVSNGIPGVEIVASPLALASKQQPQGRAGAARAGFRQAALRLDAG